MHGGWRETRESSHLDRPVFTLQPSLSLSSRSLLLLEFLQLLLPLLIKYRKHPVADVRLHSSFEPNSVERRRWLPRVSISNEEHDERELGSSEVSTVGEDLVEVLRKYEGDSKVSFDGSHPKEERQRLTFDPAMALKSSLEGSSGLN